jgi:hypothetical protein
MQSAAVTITSACSAAAMGFELCAVRTRDETIAVAVRGAAAFLRSLQRAVVTAARSQGIDARPRARTCDRLRWEWLASTASVLDPTPDGRLASECARLLTELEVSSTTWLPERIVGRLRMALAEARSLAATIERMRPGTALAFG